MTRSLLLLATLGLLALAAACTSDDPEATPTATSTPAATAVESPTASPEPTATPTRTAATPSPTPTEGPRSVAFGPSDARWGPPAEPAPEGNFRQLVYQVDEDALWTLAAPDGTPYYLTWSPHDDRAIAVRGQQAQGDETDTVLLDPATGEVRTLLPFSIGVVEWPEPDRVLVRVGIVIGGRDGPRGWTRGLYELDLVAETMTLLGEGDYASEAVPVPDDSQLAPGRLERRVFPDDGWSALVYIPDDGDESIIRDRLAQIVWSPDDSRVALVGTDNLLTVFDTRSGVPYPLGAPAFWGQLSWSPDGRYLAASLTSLRGNEAVIFDLQDLDQLLFGDELAMRGPFEPAIFADWGPGETPSEALLLGDYCEAFLLDRLDLETGDVRRLSTETGGFWVYDWSPRGDLIAVSAWEVGTDRESEYFALIDADSGATRDTPALSEAVMTMQDVAWSASGEWIALWAIGGRDRCFV